VTAAAAKGKGYPCKGGCGRTLHLSDFQTVMPDGRAYCMSCEVPAAAPDPVRLAVLLDGVCPECGKELREWRRGVFVCIGADDGRGGCGFQAEVPR
jgi:hypothetical protein